MAFVLGWARVREKNECSLRFLGNDGGRIQYHAEGQRHSSRVAGNKHRDHVNAQSTGEREPALGFVLPRCRM